MWKHYLHNDSCCICICLLGGVRFLLSPLVQYVRPISGVLRPDVAGIWGHETILLFSGHCNVAGIFLTLKLRYNAWTNYLLSFLVSHEVIHSWSKFYWCLVIKIMIIFMLPHWQTFQTDLVWSCLVWPCCLYCASKYKHHLGSLVVRATSFHLHVLWLGHSKLFFSKLTSIFFAVIET